VQREKEDADDYRYFPDPDLVPVVVSREWSEGLCGKIGELPLSRAKRYAADFALGHKDCAALVDDGPVSEFFDAVVRISVAGGVEPARAGKAAANLVLQSGQKRANERTRVRIRKAQERGESGATVPPVLVSDLGITPEQAAGIIALRESGGRGGVSAQAADEVFGLLCSLEEEPGESAGRGGSYPPGTRPEDVARERGLLIVRNEKDLDAWCEQAITADAKSAADVRAGKVQAVGRLVGAVMKLSAGKADAAEVRSMLLSKLGGAEK
jgi:aspartyl-tRNA(Asn)/glutamyl-tRNA(Gln) amidotransferase subunit B